MTPYKSKSGKKSGVSAYEIGDDFIKVKIGEKLYKYTYLKNKPPIIEHMKLLAIDSLGLSTYIARNKKTLGFI